MLCTLRLCVWSAHVQSEWFGVMSRRRDVLEESGACQRRFKAWREVCVDVLGCGAGCLVVCIVWIVCVARFAHVQSEWLDVMSRRRDVLEESGACRPRCKGWREVCVLFSDVVLVVWLCASFG